MAFCRQCGTSIADNAQFCPNCGTPTAVPTQPVYTVPVYTAPVYAAPVAAVKKPEPTRLLNIACIIILGICLLTWLFIPYISTSYSTYVTDYEYVYDEWWDDYTWEYVDRLEYRYYEGSAGAMVIDLIDGYVIPDLLDDGPFVLTALFSFFFITLGILFTFLKKMAVVRAMGIANTATLGFLGLIQLIVSGDMQGATFGFWMLLVGSIVLIVMAKQRYATEPAA